MSSSKARTSPLALAFATRACGRNGGNNNVDAEIYLGWGGIKVIVPNARPTQSRYIKIKEPKLVMLIHFNDQEGLAFHRGCQGPGVSFAC